MGTVLALIGVSLSDPHMDVKAGAGMRCIYVYYVSIIRPPLGDWEQCLTPDDHVHNMNCSTDGAGQGVAATINIPCLHMVLYFNAMHDIHEQQKEQQGYPYLLHFARQSIAKVNGCIYVLLVATG